MGIIVVLQQVKLITLAFSSSAQPCWPLPGCPGPDARLLRFDAIICGEKGRAGLSLGLGTTTQLEGVSAWKVVLEVRGECCTVHQAKVLLWEL